MKQNHLLYFLNNLKYYPKYITVSTFERGCYCRERRTVRDSGPSLRKHKRKTERICCKITRNRVGNPRNRFNIFLISLHPLLLLLVCLQSSKWHIKLGSTWGILWVRFKIFGMTGWMLQDRNCCGHNMTLPPDAMKSNEHSVAYSL